MEHLKFEGIYPNNFIFVTESQVVLYYRLGRAVTHKQQKTENNISLRLKRLKEKSFEKILKRYLFQFYLKNIRSLSYAYNM